jgi:Ca2+-binding RTX toxin-like protein
LFATTLFPDFATGGLAVLINGTPGNDTIRVRYQSDGINVRVNGVDEGTFNDPAILRVVAFADEGNDIVTADSIGTPLLEVPAYLYGQGGNDIVRGADDSDVLLGGTGNDIVMGNRGRDLLIGGDGADLLIGEQHDDILVSGTTLYDDEGLGLTNQIQFVDLMREWNRNDGQTMPGMTAQDDYNERVMHVTTVGGAGGNNSFTWLHGDGPDQTVFDDGCFDILTGNGGIDLYFYNTDSRFNDSDPSNDPAVRDIVLDRSSNEVAADIDYAATA